jgi:hypothetical protein
VPTAQIHDFLRRLRGGHADPSDLVYLDQLKAADLILELTATHPIRFQQRQLKGKWEVGLARTVEHRLVLGRLRDSLFMAVQIVPVLRHCLMLSGQADAVTGFSTTPQIEVRRAPRLPHGVALTSYRGFKLDRFPDGWTVKGLARKKVRLTEDFLRGRGWQFDALHLSPLATGRPSSP